MKYKLARDYEFEHAWFLYVQDRFLGIPFWKLQSAITRGSYDPESAPVEEAERRVKDYIEKKKKSKVKKPSVVYGEVI